MISSTCAGNNTEVKFNMIPFVKLSTEDIYIPFLAPSFIDTSEQTFTGVLVMLNCLYYVKEKLLTS